MSQQTASSNIIGREPLIEKIWRMLESGKSIRFTAERRIGKTSVMKKMRDNPKNWEAILIDLERVDSPIRFVEVLASELKKINSISQRVGKWIKNCLPKEIEVGAVGAVGATLGIKLPEQQSKNWRTLLEALLDDVCTSNDARIILFLDELPYMLQKIQQADKSGSTNDALEILDLLRAMRQKYSNLRMVFAGSVGIHHVIKALKGQKSASQPINDLYAVEIEPLTPADATACAAMHCETNGVSLGLKEQELLAELCNNTPFYIDKIISALALLPREKTIDAALITASVEDCLSDDHDPWEMRHFKDRLPVYYIGNYQDTQQQTQELHRLAQTILDCVAVSSKPLSIGQIFEAIKAQHAIADKTLIIDLLSDLAQDHYLASSSDTRQTKHYQFKYDLIRKWWRISQGLNSPGGAL